LAEKEEGENGFLRHLAYSSTGRSSLGITARLSVTRPLDAGSEADRFSCQASGLLVFRCA
jgi:hypothetical protein